MGAAVRAQGTVEATDSSARKGLEEQWSGRKWAFRALTSARRAERPLQVALCFPRCPGLQRRCFVKRGFRATRGSGAFEDRALTRPPARSCPSACSFVGVPIGTPWPCLHGHPPGDSPPLLPSPNLPGPVPRRTSPPSTRRTPSCTCPLERSRIDSHSSEDYCQVTSNVDRN